MDAIERITARIRLPLLARLVASLAIAAAAAYLGFKGEYRGLLASNLAEYMTCGLAVVWIALFVEVLYRYREKGMVLLVGAPFALFWFLEVIASVAP